MAVYSGSYYRGITKVRKDEDSFLPGPSQKVWNHSPSGFAWGYGGSGPAQLALALLLDVTRSAGISRILHQDFKRDYVAKWGEEWQITTEEIITWLRLAHPEVTSNEKLGGA